MASYSAGFLREADDSLTVTTDATGALYLDGFLRSPTGALVVTTSTAGALYLDGFLRAPTGALVVNSAGAGSSVAGFLRDTNGALVMASASPVTGRVAGFTRDASGRLSVTGLAFDPLTVAGLQAWYKADAGTSTTSDGVGISQWSDQSGNARHVTQATSTKRPLYKTAIQNSLPVVRFDGTDDLLQVLFTLAQPYTLFATLSYLNAFAANTVAIAGSGVPGAFLRNSANTVALYAGVIGSQITTTPQAWHAYSAEFNNTASTLRADGGTAGASSTSNTAAGGVALGSDGTGAQSANVDIGEVLIYTGILAAADRQSVEAYLKTRWGTP